MRHTTTNLIARTLLLAVLTIAPQCAVAADPPPPDGIGAFTPGTQLPGAPAGSYLVNDFDHINLATRSSAPSCHWLRRWAAERPASRWGGPLRRPRSRLHRVPTSSVAAHQTEAARSMSRGPWATKATLSLGWPAKRCIRGVGGSTATTCRAARWFAALRLPGLTL